MKKKLLILHIAVLLFGLSGLFGKLVNTSAELIVSGRVISASIFLYILVRVKKEELDMRSPRVIKIILLQGGLLFIHWFSFFHSIQLSTVALGLLSFSSFPIFTTIMEPYFFRLPLSRSRVLAALLTFVGILIVTPVGAMEIDMLRGVMFGVLSGFTFALLAIANKKLSKDIPEITLTFYQCLGASIFSLPIIFYNISSLPGERDIFLLIILGIVFTGIAHTLFVTALKLLPASTVSIAACLEPVYGIAFASIILHEIPGARVLLGSTLIILAALSTVVMDREAVTT